MVGATRYVRVGVGGPSPEFTGISRERCQHGTVEEVTTTPLFQQPRDNLDNQRQAEACNGSDSSSRQRRGE